MEREFDIIIVGGGLNGCALALALSGAGLSCLIVEREARSALSSDRFDGRSYALAQASTRALDAIGIWPHIVDKCQPMLEIKVTDGRAGEGPSPFWMHFDHAELGDAPMGFMVEDRYLRQAYLDAIEASETVELVSDVEVIAQIPKPNGITVETDDGTTYFARLLIGADGRRSGTAERAGISRDFKDYGQTAQVAAIGHEKPHGGIAHQFFMPAGPLAILPLTGNRSSIVWAVDRQQAEALGAMDNAAFLDALRPAFGSFLGEIDLVGARFSYPLNKTLADRMIAPRVALIGDAAHGIHPIAGQGLNQGLRDVSALAEVLVGAKRRGQDFAAMDVLENYEQWRRFDRTLLATATDTFNTLFSNDNAIVRAARGIGMGIVNSVPALRRGFIREAAGLTGDIPKLLRGEPL